MLPSADPVLADEGEQYDIFISSSDEDYLFVTSTVIPVIENDCELRVCFADRDFPQNRSIFNTYVDMIRKSRKIIVILSHAYMMETRCILLQLEHIILPLVYEQLRTPKDILIIKYEENIVVPELLRWNFQIKVYPWFTNLPEQVKIRKLKQWILTGHI
jgi:hypothetical protein